MVIYTCNNLVHPLCISGTAGMLANCIEQSYKSLLPFAVFLTEKRLVWESPVRVSQNLKLFIRVATF